MFGKSRAGAKSKVKSQIAEVPVLDAVDSRRNQTILLLQFDLLLLTWVLTSAI
jgi:hypothetical protein